MKVEIWSDIMCPFCYIGKRKFEQALEQFEHKDEIQVEWHSFQLQPDMKAQPGKNINQWLAEAKGISTEQALQMNAHVIQMAKEVGLNYDFDQMKVNNTLDAHRLTHLAARHNLQDQAEERIFKAYFTEGHDVGDRNTLLQLAAEIGLDKEETEKMLASDEFAYDVAQDQQEAANLGIRGVPFFVLNRRYGISGAQPAEVFLQALQQAWQEEKAAGE